MKKFLVYYFVFLVSFLSLFVSGVIDSQDGFQYLAVARNIYYKHEPTAPPYKYDTRENVHMSVYKGRDGKTYSLTGLGYSLAFLPSVALTDIVYNIYDIAPSVNFPLENDWLILLTASFTNVFFTALLGAVMFLYLKEIKLKNRTALLISFITIIATNLFVYSKHLMPHSMFVTFLVTTFYFLKVYSRTKKPKHMLFSGLSYGVVIITYNTSFLLAIPPLIAYFLLLTKPKVNINYIKRLVSISIYFVLGLLPFITIYSWFENTRSSVNINITPGSAVTKFSSHIFSNMPLTVFFEGLFGQLFSPGRSIFIYTPLLLIPILFWHKITKKIRAEWLTLIVISVVFISFYSTLFSVGRVDQGIAGLWHGESSWGPRYLTPIIPFAMLVVGYIYQKLSKKHKLFVFYPLVVAGIIVQLLGTVLPYQVKYHNLQKKFFVNSTEYTMYLYSNLLPRYSPLITMAKETVKLVKRLPDTIDNGTYNVRFYDGIDFPFDVGPERWRSIDRKGHIKFDNTKEGIKQITFDLINHPIATTEARVKIDFLLNNTNLNLTPETLNVTERERITLEVKPDTLKPTNNNLVIETEFSETDIAEKQRQIVGLISIFINGDQVNLESIDIPYVSDLGPKLTGVEYKNWGGLDRDPWKYWHIHTQMYERLPDFWWARNLYYWDIPNMLITSLFIGNIAILLLSGPKVKRFFKKGVSRKS
jgi:hypothetical protein